MSLVSTRQDGDDNRLALVSLDRAGAGNALSQALCRDLTEALTHLPSRTHAVVLASSTEHFCVGADLRERRTLDREGLLAARADSRAATAALLGCPVPVVAAVHGFALGGGLELALAADLVVADPDAVLGLPEVSVGIVPGGGGTQLLAARVGQGVAAELLLTARQVAAQEALDLRLVDRLSKAGSVHEEAVGLAARVARNSPRSVALVRRAIRAGRGLPLEDALNIEDGVWCEAAFSADYQEGLTAFAEKRRPVWPSAASLPSG